MSASNTAKSNEIIITRSVNAPIQRVWQMLTHLEHIQHWWGPNGFTNTILEMDVRVDGIWRYVMHGPAHADGSPGMDYNNWIRYTTVTEPTLLAYDHGGDDEVHAMFSASVTLEDLGEQSPGTTQVTLKMVLQSEAQRQQLAEFGAIEGGEQTLARLDAYVSPTPDDKCFSISRSFDAPLALMWQAWSEPERFAQWWGPKGCAIAVKKMNFVDGGETHYSMAWPGVAPMWGKFVYGKIAPQKGFEFINSFSDEAGDIVRAPYPGMDNWPLQVFNTLTFTEEGGKTTVTLRGGPINATEAERTMFASSFNSMTQGFGGTFEQLDAYLKSC